MFGRQCFDYVNHSLKTVHAPHQMFGGLSGLAIGDLFQLRPICQSWIFDDTTDSNGLPKPNLWREHFKLYELTEIMRQRDEQVWAERLNRLREGMHTEDDTAFFMSLVDKYHACKDDLDTLLHLFRTNKQVDEHNKKVFDAHNGERVIITACDCITDPNVTPGRRNFLLSYMQNTKDCCKGMPYSLPVKVGLPMELCINIDNTDGLCNGVEGIVRAIHTPPGRTVPGAI